MSLKDQLQAIADQANAEMGIAVLHIESGEKTELNGDQFYPMASVFKIPVLATLFHQWRQGRLRLDDRRTLKEEFKSPGSGILPFFEAGVTPTIVDLATLMIIISDNTATDMLVERVGGPLAVEAFMHEIGLNEIYLKMDCKALLSHMLPPGDYTPEEREKIWLEMDYPKDSLVFARTPENNISTPRAMTELVKRIFNAEIVDREASDQMLAILLKQQLNARLPRFLPPGTKFAHKTGTIGGTRNDSGIIYLDDNNHVAVTAYVSWDAGAVFKQPEPEQQRIFEIETAMGRVGRAVYDYYARQ